jgi:sugar/nucleoside kinase (ribokinase family)
MPQFDVTIAGELNLDLILYGLPAVLETERELLADNMTLTLGSSSAIVAHNLAALGCRVGFISRIGDDAMGKLALERLAESGVDVSRVRRDGNSKTGITVVLQHGAQRHMLTYMGTIAELGFEDLDLDYLKSSRHFHLSSFYLQHKLRPRVPELFQKLKAAGLTVSLDTNDDPEDAWQGSLTEALRLVDVFLPNEREAKRIAGTDDLEAAISCLSAMVPLVVVKMGNRGARAQCRDRQLVSPSVPVDIVDAVGAGDSFNAGFLSQYVAGAELTACLAAGNLAGAFSTMRPGGTEAFRDRNARESFWREHRP